MSPYTSDETQADTLNCGNCGSSVVFGDLYCGSCAAPVPDATEALLLDELRQVTLGEYEIVGTLGRGGMGIVYLANDLALNRKVAIKVLPPGMTNNHADVERFRREARIAAALKHPNITALFVLRETPRIKFFVMEYVPGRALSSIVQSQGTLSAGMTAAIMLDVADALAYAHENGITHRDVKPGNVIVNTSGMAVVTDFGVAKSSAHADSITSTGFSVGSPLYMSPEQWSGQATHLSDQYSLGVLAYEMLTGTVPYRGETVQDILHKQLTTTPAHIRDVVKDCPERLSHVIMRMLEKEPADRWPSLRVMLSDVGVKPPGSDHPIRRRSAELARQQSEVGSLPMTPRSPIPVSRASSPKPAQPNDDQPKHPPRRRRGRKLLVTATVLAILTAGGFAAYTNRSALQPYVQQGLQRVLAWTGSSGAEEVTDTDVAPPISPTPERVYSYVALAVTPESAQVRLDSTPLGPANELDSVIETPIGRVTITIESEGFLPVDSVLELAERDTMRLAFVLEPEAIEPQLGRLRFSVGPVPGVIRIDGGQSATGTRFDRNLSTGNRTIRITADGYAAYERTVVIEASETLNLGFISLDPLPPGNLALRIQPGFADVYVDGELRSSDRANLTLTNLPAGRRVLRILKQDFAVREFTHFIQSGRTDTLNVSLTRAEWATAVIQITPTFADVYLDGELVASERQQVVVGPFPPGIDHALSVRRIGYETRQIVVNLAPGERREIPVRIQGNR